MKHYLFAAGAILCWASLPAATGSGLDSLNPEELMFYSFLPAALLLWGTKAIKTRKLSITFPPLKMSILGIWGIFGYHYLYYQALDHSSLTEGAILTTSWSFWIVIFSSVLAFRRLKAGILLTALIGMGGIALVITAGKGLSFQSEYIPGYILAIACSLVWSSFSVILGRMKEKKDHMSEFTVLAAALSTLLYLLTFPHSLPQMNSLLSAVYLGAVPLGLSFVLWNRALQGGSLVIIGYLSYLTTPLAVLIVALVYREEVPLQVYIGMAVIIAASVLGRAGLKSSRSPEDTSGF